MDFCLLLKIWLKVLAKIQVKTCVLNTDKNLVIPNNPLQLHLRLSQKEQFNKTSQVTGELISSKITDRIRKILKTSQQNNLETVRNEHDKEIPNQKYISLEESQEIIDDLR